MTEGGLGSLFCQDGVREGVEADSIPWGKLCNAMGSFAFFWEMPCLLHPSPSWSSFPGSCASLQNGAVVPGKYKINLKKRLELCFNPHWLRHTWLLPALRRVSRRSFELS